MAEGDFHEENCENCVYLTSDDQCGNSQSVFFDRPAVYRDGDEVLQAGWCELWAPGTPGPLTN
jgi:hypothetical protein